jgi:hypothetical protein
MGIHGQNVGVGHGVRRGEFETATPDRIEARIGGEFGGQWIVRRHCQRRAMHVEFCAQGSGG